MDWSEVWRKDVSDSLTVGPSTKSRERLMLSLLARSTNLGGSLLDVGCGKGELLAAIFKQKRFGKLSGVDLSDVPLAHARRVVPGADFSVLDVCDGSLSERFDVITCMMTLDLVRDDDAATRHLSEMLKPGGRLLVVVQHLKQYGSELDDRFGVRRHDQASLTSLLGGHGLAPVQLFSWGFPLYSAYYQLLYAGASDAVGSSRARSRLFHLASAALLTAFRIDDLFTWTQRGRVLFGVFEKRA